jgi:hypothetical protein
MTELFYICRVIITNGAETNRPELIVKPLCDKDNQIVFKPSFRECLEDLDNFPQTGRYEIKSMIIND